MPQTASDRLSGVHLPHRDDAIGGGRGDLADEMSMEDLLSALSDYMLESGFESQYSYFQQMDEHSLEALRQAIQQALEAGDFLDQEMRERLEKMQMDGALEELI